MLWEIQSIDTSRNVWVSVVFILLEKGVTANSLEILPAFRGNKFKTVGFDINVLSRPVVCSVVHPIHQVIIPTFENGTRKFPFGIRGFIAKFKVPG